MTPRPGSRRPATAGPGRVVQPLTALLVPTKEALQGGGCYDPRPGSRRLATAGSGRVVQPPTAFPLPAKEALQGGGCVTPGPTHVD